MKRWADIAVASLGIVLLSPLLLLVALAVRLKLGSPVIFVQPRPGLAGKPFLLYKFRTMSETRDASGERLPDSERLTGFGRWLRRTSLDELPELYNVIKGDMSIVGPRPLLMEYLPLYTPQQAKRHAVRPGLTGWAQVNGRNGISWEQKFQLDVWYVEHRCWWLDLKIIALTLQRVISAEGVNPADRLTVDRFRGSE